MNSEKETPEDRFVKALMIDRELCQAFSKERKRKQQELAKSYGFPTHWWEVIRKVDAAREKAKALEEKSEAPDECENLNDEEMEEFTAREGQNMSTRNYMNPSIYQEKMEEFTTRECHCHPHPHSDLVEKLIEVITVLAKKEGSTVINSGIMSNNSNFHNFKFLKGITRELTDKDFPECTTALSSSFTSVAPDKALEEKCEAAEEIDNLNDEKMEEFTAREGQNMSTRNYLNPSVHQEEMKEFTSREGHCHPHSHSDVVEKLIEVMAVFAKKENPTSISNFGNISSITNSDVNNFRLHQSTNKREVTDKDIQEGTTALSSSFTSVSKSNHKS